MAIRMAEVGRIGVLVRAVGQWVGRGYEEKGYLVRGYGIAEEDRKVELWRQCQFGEGDLLFDGQHTNQRHSTKGGEEADRPYSSR